MRLIPLFEEKESSKKFHKLLKNLKRSSDIDINVIIYAKNFAKYYHRNQKRISGEPYYTHIIEVAYILTENTKVNQDSLVAALLHDIVEDTHIVLSQIGLIFGEKVAFFVDKLSKLESNVKKFRLDHKEIKKKLNLLKNENKEVIYIKLADRLHNMRTLNHILLQSKRERIAKNTLEVFVPLAKSCKLKAIEEELKTLSDKYL